MTTRPANPLPPLLVVEWHPDLNGYLYPQHVTAGSNRKVWWRCAFGHEWEAPIKSRARGIGCPVCAGRLVPLPAGMVAEWHPDRNGTLTPDQITTGSARKVWWRCAAGHEWQASVVHRTYDGAPCPMCAGRSVPLSPELVAEWHPTRNYGIAPEQVTSGSMLQVWWRCAAGHDWLAPVYSRARSKGKGRGCPVCHGRVALPGVNDLATVDPVLSAEWHPSLNGSLTPRDVMPSSNKHVWWRCREGHDWRSGLRIRSQGAQCPICGGQRTLPGVTDLATVNPALAAEWHPTRNGALTPDRVVPGSGKKVWWRCRSGHEWATEVRIRSRGAGCPACDGRPQPGRPSSSS